MLIGFRGTGFRTQKYQSEPGLVKAGHVGFAFEEDPSTIYGFHPTRVAEQSAGGEQSLIDLLKEHQKQRGSIQIDTLIFERANELFNAGELDGQTEVWLLIREVSQEEYNRIRQTVLKWYQEQTDFWYNFPDINGQFSAPDEYNCAVFPAMLGIESPTENGLIRKYIEAMRDAGAIRWSPTISL
jgi:hypothetical protein